jgi:hypothetical protein
MFIPRPERVRNIGSRNYKNEITIIADENPHVTASLVAARMNEITSRSHKEAFMNIGGSFSDIPLFMNIGPFSDIPPEQKPKTAEHDPVGTLRALSIPETHGGEARDRLHSQFKGTWQMSDAMRKEFGGNDPSGSPWPRGSAEERDATSKAMASVTKQLRHRLGRDPTDAEVYLGWNQGVGGASKIIKTGERHPTAPASKAMRAQSREVGGREKTYRGFLRKEHEAISKAQEKERTTVLRKLNEDLQRKARFVTPDTREI